VASSAERVACDPGARSRGRGGRSGPVARGRAGPDAAPVARGLPRPDDRGGAGRALPGRRRGPERGGRRLVAPRGRRGGRDPVARCRSRAPRRVAPRARRVARAPRRRPTHGSRRRCPPVHGVVPARWLRVAHGRRTRVVTARAGPRGACVRRRRARGVPGLRPVDDHGARLGHPPRGAPYTPAVPPELLPPRRAPARLARAAPRGRRPARPPVGASARRRAQHRRRPALPRARDHLGGPRARRRGCPADRRGRPTPEHRGGHPMRSRWHLRANTLVALWLLAAGVVALVHRWVPSAEWLMVHLLLLGAVSTAILVWSAHFAEALRRHPLPGGYRDQAVRLGMHTLGSLAVIDWLVADRLPALVAGAVLVAAATVWHGVVLVVHARRGLGTQLGWTAWFYVAAAAALPLGAGLGVVLAKAGGELSSRAYLGHVATMLLGWVGLTVVGTLVSLWPTMLGTGLAPDSVRAARHGLVMLGTAMVMLVLAVGGGVRWLFVAGLLGYAAGLVRTSWPLLAEARVRRPHTFAARSVAAAQLWLFVSVLAWAVVSVTAHGWAEAEQATGALLGPFAAGFAGQVLLGSLCHLGPMILGGGPTAVRAARAVVEKGAGARLVLVNGGLVLFARPAPSLVRVTASVLALVGAAWTLALVVAAAVVSLRARATAGPPTVRPAEVLAASRRTTHGSGLAAGVVLLLAVAVSVGVDPAAVGVGAAADDGVPASGDVVEVEVEAHDMRFEPSSVEVAPGDELVL